MPIYLKVKLTEEEKEELLKLKQAVSTPKRTRSRIETLIFSERGFSIKEIATLTGQKESTIRKSLGRWMVRGQEGLFDRPRKGRLCRWEEEDIKYLETCLESEPRTYNSYQLAEKLKQKRKIDLSPQRIRKILKKKDYRWKRTRVSLRS